MNNFFKNWHTQKLGLYFVILFNLALLGEYLYDPGNAKYIVGIFWIQSVLLGFENVFKILFAKTGEIINVNNVPTPTNMRLNAVIAFFFCIHFGVFILIFGLMGIFSKNIPTSNIDKIHLIWPTLIVMFIGVIIEIPGKIMAVRKESPGFARLMFLPYLRLLPFVVLIFVKDISPNIMFLLFLAVKMGMDVIHYYLAEKPTHQHLLDAI